jgi:hypothetical protein
MSAWLAEAHFSGSNYSVAGRPSASRVFLGEQGDRLRNNSITAGVVLVLSPIIVTIRD